jgi:hypothetical protein
MNPLDAGPACAVCGHSQRDHKHSQSPSFRVSSSPQTGFCQIPGCGCGQYVDPPETVLRLRSQNDQLFAAAASALWYLQHPDKGVPSYVVDQVSEALKAAQR